VAIAVMVASDVSHGRDVMDQQKRLKLAAVFFAVFWIGGMLWWSGEYHPAYVILLAVCGSLGGYLWFLAMRWFFSHMHRLN
jgi:UDP-N-acetylmuramyl pentapeptide phosphotransferase/UDP-N-acetylglucosamine-1-phosphate transferase